MTKTTKTNPPTTNPAPAKPVLLGAKPKTRKPRAKSDRTILRNATLSGMAADPQPVTIHEQDDAGRFVGTVPNPEQGEGQPERIAATWDPEQDYPEGFEPNVATEYPQGFVVTAEQMGVAHQSIQVTVGAWAKDAGVAISCHDHHDYIVVEVL